MKSILLLLFKKNPFYVYMLINVNNEYTCKYIGYSNYMYFNILNISYFKPL